MQSVNITTKVVSSNPAHGEVYSIQHCDKVCQWLATGQWFSPGTPVSSINKAYLHDIAEILLKVALNTITIWRHLYQKYILYSLEEEFEDTKVVIRIRISKTNRQHNGQKIKKKTQKDKQQSTKHTHKTKLNNGTVLKMGYGFVFHLILSTWTN